MAHRAAAIVEPRLQDLYGTLKLANTVKLTGARWQAGYDLAMGRVLAMMVRTSTYNTILAKAKGGMKFEKDDSDTWVLVAADEVTATSALEKMAAQSREYLTRVREHIRARPGLIWPNAN